MRQRLHLRRGIAADDGEAGGGMDRLNPGQYVAGETLHRVHIGAIVHLSGEDEQRAFAAIDQIDRRGGIEIVERDAIFDGDDAVRAKAGGVAEQRGFGFAHETGQVGAHGDAAFEIEQQPPFAAIDPGHGAAALPAIGGIFSRVEIDEIHHEADARGQWRHEMRHLRGIGEDRTDRSLVKRLPHPAMQAGMVEQRHQHRLALGKAGEARNQFRPVAPQHALGGGDLRQIGGKAHVAIIVGKAADMHRRDLRQALQHVAGADLVAAIGRKGNAVAQEQNVAVHPRPRAISGPIRLATGSGNVFHRSMRR